MQASVARQMHRTLEPYHGMIYFVPEAQQEYDSLGLQGRRMGYFASRAAAMGPVSADVVVATFFNFNPELVRQAIPAAWRRADPAQLVQARRLAADRALRRLLGAELAGEQMREAAQLARVAVADARPEGRPLYAAHAELDWPDEAHLVLWHALTLAREYRGDGHIAALVAQGVDAVEALLLHEASGDLPAGVLQPSRGWPDAAWQAGAQRLRERGWLDGDGALTDDGRSARGWVEERTDSLALALWSRLSEPDCARLRALVRPWSRTIAEQAFGGGLSWD